MNAAVGGRALGPSPLAIISLLLGLLAISVGLVAFVMIFLAVLVIPVVALMTLAGIACAVFALKDAGRPRGLALAGLLCNAIALVPACVFLSTYFL